LVKEVVKEYVDRRKDIENEVKILREDMKALDEDFKDKIDLKAVKAALRILKLRESSNEDLVDSVIEILDVTSLE
jgi:uncharacterized protein (UPF0335 family)